MNYVKEIYIGTEDKLTSVPFARTDNLAYFIVHDFDNNCDICYNFRLPKDFISSCVDEDCKLVNLKSSWEFPFKLRFYIFGIERNFIFAVNKAQSKIVKYLTLKKRICFNLQGYKTLVPYSDGTENFSSLSVFCSMLGLSGVDSNCFYVTYSKPIHFFYYISDLEKFKVAILKYKIRYPDTTVVVNFANM